ncbi:MAG TPA: TonB-dependent receptor [Anaeromyxobacteraceae bacterium]|nr:TonB-dependent receptor [Anaeromyxobacteraceae bacterium]
MTGRALAAHLATLALALAAPPRAAAAEPPAAGEPSLATPPRLKELVPAELPPGTSFPSPEVTVILSLEVGASGRVERASVESGTGEPFDGAALAAARRFEFEPGRLASGEAVPVTVTFRMRIREPAPAAPPPFRLAGRLLERGSREPLAGVAVVARSEGQVLARATTDAEGRFAVEVRTSSFTLAAAPEGHQRLEALVKGEPGETREENFYLESLGGPNETVVSATPLLREVMKQVLTAEQVAVMPGSSGDALQAVLNLPGAARAPFGSGLLILRGSAPGDSRVFLEGQEIPQLYHFGGIRSTFAPTFLESIEFVPGNFSVDYGRAQGGIIDVRVRDPSPLGFHGEADVNLYDVAVEMEGGLGGGWSLGGAFRRSWIDTFLRAVIPKDAHLSFTTAPRFYDFQFIATWRPDPSQRLRLMFYGSMDRVVALLEEPEADPTITGTFDALVSFYNLQADYLSALSSKLRQDTSLVLGLQEVDTGLGPQYFFDLKLRRLAARTSWTLELSPVLQGRAGIDAEVYGADVSLNLPNAAGPNPVPPSTLPQIGTTQYVVLYYPAAFAELRIAPFPSLSFLPGVRVDWYSDIRRWAVDPRLLMRWQVGPTTVLKAGIGLYQQPPEPQESAAVIGTPDLLPERSLQVSAGVLQTLAPGVTLEVTPFYKALDRQVIPNANANYDPSQPRYTNLGTGKIYGVETLLKVNLGDRFSGWLAYTFQRSFRTDPPSPQMPFDFDQPNNLTVLGTYQLGRGWSIGARYRLISGNPDTPVLSSIYDSATGVYVPVYGATNSERLGTFWALDIRVDKVWTFKDWKLTLYLDTQNVTNHKNQEDWLYNYDYSQRTELTGLPILPILGIKGDW